ncbi:hypothetical protein NK6_8287 [Bradyrhizobium diazoefficiens]|uniref:Uncharacterized protein n=1 Tax=Bradyrhizobium diazoefficiens TaxID=1355477 RepID=A0A0E4BVV6_9BRAD|nr:hypothetical protein NK6_8287 [Bradyrhizobium diazoefficiens]
MTTAQPTTGSSAAREHQSRAQQSTSARQMRWISTVL